MSSLADLFQTARSDESFAVARANAESQYELIFDLVSARKAAGLRQQDVAELLDISQQAVSKIEDSEGDPRLSTLRTYATAIGVLLGHSVQSVSEHQGPVERWVARKIFMPVAASQTRESAPTFYKAANAKRTDFAIAA